MNWISEFFFCVGSMSIAGSVAAGLYCLFRKRLRRAKSGMAIQILKIIVIMYLFPVSYLAVRTMRMGVSVEYLYATGYFGINTSPLFIKIFSLVGLIWLLGLVVGIFKGIIQYRKLRGMMLFNIPVSDPKLEEILREECGRYHLDGVKLCENEMILSPMVTNILHPTIVIPRYAFTEQNMHIILEHEVNHIRKHDLIWKRVAMFVSWLHWFNPLAYWLFDWIDMEQEVECDLHVCSTTKYYTAKEYYEFMLTLMEHSSHKVFTSGLGDSDNRIIRRIEIMKERRTRGKASKWSIFGICLILVLLSVSPAYAMAKGVADAEEKWLAETEVVLDEAEAVAVAASTGESALIEFTVLENNADHQEVYLDEGVSPYSSIVVIDITGKANTRYSFKAQSMQVGDEVTITVQCDNPNVVFWIGIKNVNTNVARYLEGTERLYHVFTINEAGTYRVFVENRSNTDAEFLGSGIYPY